MKTVNMWWWIVVVVQLTLHAPLTVTAAAPLDTRSVEDCVQRLVLDRPVLVSSASNGSTPSSARPCTYLLVEPPHTLPDHFFQVSLVSFILGRRSRSGDACSGGWARLGGSLYCGTASSGTLALLPAPQTGETLELALQSPLSSHEFRARVELLPRLSLQERHPEMILVTPGEHVSFTQCDRVYSCLEHPGYCQITSPGYPGVFPRPMTCNFTLKSPEVGVIIGGKNELFEMGEWSRISHQGCDTEDFLAIYDGGELVGKFCGKGWRFPRIISKSTDLTIVFRSTKAGPPARGFALSLERAPPHVSGHANCSQVIRVGTEVQTLKSPHHWLGPREHCTYNLLTRPGRQIWLLLTGLRTRSNCSKHDDHVTVYDGLMEVMRFCKQTQEAVPIVSKSNQLRLVYTSPNGTFDATSRFSFVAKFAAINSSESGVHVENTWCDTVFSSKYSGPFSLFNPKELILQNMRNMTRNLICKYRFVAPESHTVRLKFELLAFEPLRKCTSVLDNCESLNYDHIVMTEKSKEHVLGCECGAARRHEQTFHSRGSELVLELHVNLNYELLNNSLKYSPELYQFRGSYQFVPPAEGSLHCGNYVLTNRSLRFPSKPNSQVITPIMCFWTLKHVLISSLNLEHFRLSAECKHNYLVLRHGTAEFKLCQGDTFNSTWLQGERGAVHMYLVASKGHPEFSWSWESPSTSPHITMEAVPEEEAIEIGAELEEECISGPTLALLVAGAALVTLILVLAVVLLLWRYRASLTYTWRHRHAHHYSSVTRSGAFW